MLFNSISYFQYLLTYQFFEHIFRKLTVSISVFRQDPVSENSIQYYIASTFHGFFSFGNVILHNMMLYDIMFFEFISL